MDKLIKLVISSKKRIEIISELSKNPCTLANLSKALNSKPPNVITQLKKLESEGIVESRGKTYALSEFGKIIYEVLMGFMGCMDIVKKHDYFWKSHDTSSIPNYLLRRIWELGNCNVIKNPSESIYELHEDIISNIMSSNEIWGISSVYHPKYSSLFSKLAKDGKNINLIITEPLSKKIVEEIPDKFDNINLYIIRDDVKLSMIVTDKFLCLVLYSKNGCYDAEKFLISFDRTALMWGADLYEYYLKKSRKLTN